MIGVPDTSLERMRGAMAHELNARTRRAFGELCERSLLAFCATYLPRRFSLEFGEVHERSARVIQDLMRPDAQRRRLAIAMPPKHGKTSLVAFGLPLWAVCARGERRVCVVTRTADAARELFNDLAAALRPGEPLALAHPHAALRHPRQNVGTAEGPQPTCNRSRSEREDPEGSKGRFAGDLTLRNGACISVVSRFRSVTGAGRTAQQPSLLVFDDLETWSTPGIFGHWGSERFHEDERDRHEPLKAWIDFNLERRLVEGGRCVAVGSIAGPDTWLAARCDRFNRDGWSKMATPAELRFPPAAESDRAVKLMRGNRRYERAMRAALAKVVPRAAWRAGAPLEETKALRRRAENASPYGSPWGIAWFDALWHGWVTPGDWNGWSKVTSDEPATARYLTGGVSMLEEDAKAGVRAFLAIDSKLADRRWFPDSDPPPDAKAQEEARMPIFACVHERAQGGETPTFTMCNFHQYEPVTDPDIVAYWRFVGWVLRLGHDAVEDLRKPEERDRLAERARERSG